MKLIRAGRHCLNNYFARLYEKVETLHIQHGNVYDTQLKMVVSFGKLKSLTLENCNQLLGNFAKKKKLRVGASQNNELHKSES